MLTPGTMFGSYQVVGSLGAGGMGEVYRARDTQLKREVALKVLPAGFADDPDRLARFQREAELLASLNHPNIAAVYGLEHAGGQTGIVLELVEGDTLAERIQGAKSANGSATGAASALPIDEALSIARQIAGALEAAHERGIIHRDLKPANIKVTPEGAVKVLDFGLAKMLDPETASSALSMSPTLSVHATQAGVILGTAAYMSPEQARGKTADRRTDIWSFGCVLYEMLTGAQLFAGGDTVSDAVAAILKTEPDWTRLPADTPAHVRTLLRRCLQKDVQKRLPHIGLVRMELDDAKISPGVSAAIQAVSPRRDGLAWLLAAIMTLVAVGALTWGYRPRPIDGPELRVDLATPTARDVVNFAVSPDGRTVVFVGTSNGTRQLFLRALDSSTPRVLANTEGAAAPFWAPSSRSLGFFAGGTLKRVDIDRDGVQSLANAPGQRGGAWDQGGTILFAPNQESPIFRIAATGGEPSAVTRLVEGQVSHRLPHFLPDGKSFLYYVQGTSEIQGVYVGQIDQPDTRRLVSADAAAVYVPPGYLLFVRQGNLLAQSFHTGRLELTGEPFPVADQVAVATQGNIAALSTSASGVIAYRTGSYRAGPPVGRRQFVWFDRAGKEIARIGEPDDTDPVGPWLSPDGQHLALQRSTDGNQDIWRLDLRRGVLSRFTSDPAIDSMPAWSPDGGRIVFQTRRDGEEQIYEKPASGMGRELPLLTNTQKGKSPSDWSSDGRFLLYGTESATSRRDLWVLPLQGDRKPFPVVESSSSDRDGQFSADGKWIAFESNESGRDEVYVQPFPGPGRKVQISTAGGAQVRWRRDGTEIFYLALDGRLTAVPIKTGSPGEGVQAGTPQPLFTARVGAIGGGQGGNRQQYIPSPDGQRFLMNVVVEEPTIAPLTLILNWHPKE